MTTVCQLTYSSEFIIGWFSIDRTWQKKKKKFPETCLSDLSVIFYSMLMRWLREFNSKAYLALNDFYNAFRNLRFFFQWETATIGWPWINSTTSFLASAPPSSSLSSLPKPATLSSGTVAPGLDAYCPFLLAPPRRPPTRWVTSDPPAHPPKMLSLTSLARQ